MEKSLFPSPVEVAAVIGAVSWLRQRWPKIDGPNCVLPIVLLMATIAAAAFGHTNSWREFLTVTAGLFLSALGGDWLARRASGRPRPGTLAARREQAREQPRG